MDPCAEAEFGFSTAGADWPEELATDKKLRGFHGMPETTFTFTNPSIAYTPCTEYPDIPDDLCPSNTCNDPLMDNNVSWLIDFDIERVNSSATHNFVTIEKTFQDVGWEPVFQSGKLIFTPPPALETEEEDDETDSQTEEDDDETDTRRR